VREESLPRGPFFGPDGRRAIWPEIKARFSELTESTLVAGFKEMLDVGDAAGAEDRVSGFGEGYDRWEWLLRLDASKGMSWRTELAPATRLSRVSFLLNLGFGNGSPLPQPSGQWDIFVNDRAAASVRVVNHSILWRAGKCSLAFAANRIETAEPYQGLSLSTLIRDEAFATFGPGLLTVPSEWLDGEGGAVIRVEPASPVPSTRWMQVAPSAHLVQTSNIWSAVELLVGEGPKAGPYKVFFGDIHTHSGQVLDDCENKGCGIGTRAENYEYARGPGGLDFYALTDHEWQIDAEKPAGYLDLADAYSKDGRFACLPAFEHTNLLNGHRNVYFRESGGAVWNTNRTGGGPTLDPRECDTPSDLWAAMEKTGVPFMTVPHHASATSHPLNLDVCDPRYDRLYEIYSTWGSSEYPGDFPRGTSDRWDEGHFRDAILRGHRFGVIASSDGHDGHPGNAQSPMVKHHHVFHFCGSGLAAVLAEDLTRESVYDALHARRCYATTGVPIVLDVRIGDALMGTEKVQPDETGPPRLSVNCRGTNGLDHVRIMRNGYVAHTIPCHGEREVAVEWEDRACPPGVPASYYVRVVQKDRESAWSSPIWVGD